MHHMLAANQGPPPSNAMAFAIWGVVLLVFCVLGYAALARSSRRRQAEAPGRAAAAAHPVTASWLVKAQADERSSVRGAGMETWRLSIRGDLIEVMHASTFARALDGAEYYIPAREASIRVEPGFLGRQWLVITGTSSGQPARVSVSPKEVSRVTFEEMRQALVAAGARPEGAQQ